MHTFLVNSSVIQYSDIKLAIYVKSAVSFIYLFAGIIVGAIILTICYFVMRYTVVKLPLKPFFMFTGSFMYLMAFVFAGKSVLELIEGKLAACLKFRG